MNRATDVVKALSVAAGAEDEQINVAELLEALEPVRAALTKAREDVTDALRVAAGADSRTREERYADLRKARARRDAFKRVIFAVEHLCAQLEAPTWT